MSYQIFPYEPLGESIRRIVCQQIEAAIAASRSARNGRSSPVHETRKHLKKARSAMRFLAPEVGRRRFRREDRRLRNVGRLISDIRDAEVRLETVKELRHGPTASRRRGFRETEELLAFELDSFLAAFAGWQEEAARKLEQARAGIAHWHLRRLSCKQGCGTIRDSYKEGRRTLKRAQNMESTEEFHELRKQAKALWYHLRLLRPFRPAVFEEMSGDLKTIEEHLGHAHDLSFVAQRLESIAGAGASKRGSRALRGVIESREEDLLRTAVVLGERFYALKPKEFAAQIAYYLKAQERIPVAEMPLFAVVA